MDPVQIKRLREQHEKGLQACQKKIAQWNKFKSDYETLKLKLLTLPNGLSYDITVPFGSSAFTLGKMVHTNEILVLLGDNWFAKVSGKQAADIAQRRISHCDKMLIDLKKEEEQFENWLHFIGETAENENLTEIMEEYNEEVEQIWQEQHKKNLRELKKNEKLQLQLDDDPLKYFDEMSINESEEDLDMDSQRESSVSCEDCMTKETVQSSEYSERSDEPSSPLSQEDESVKHVRWRDLSGRAVPTITFRHSKKHNPKQKASSSEAEHGQPIVQSPSDIYTMFFPSSPPKSILKVKTPPPEDTAEDPFRIAFTGEVKEYQISQDTNDCIVNDHIDTNKHQQHRPLSHFKSARKNHRR